MPITSHPRGVKVALASIVDRPVMLTALEAMKRASIYRIDPTVHRGSMSTNEPIRIKKRKLAESMSEGFVRRPNSCIAP